MEMNMEEIEKRHACNKLIREVLSGLISLWIDDVDWLIAEVKRLRDERDSFQSAEKEISDEDMQKIVDANEKIVKKLKENEK